MVASLSDILPINGYYPTFYTDRVGANQPPTIRAKEYDYKNHSIIQNGYLYNLMFFKKFDKYSNSFVDKDGQFRLCKVKLTSSSKWDCSLIIDNKGGYYMGGVLIDSASNGKIAGGYSDIDGVYRVFLYNPKDSTVSYLRLPENTNSIGGVAYYKDNMIYDVSRKIDLANKVIYNYPSFNDYANDFSCSYGERNYQMKGNYYYLFPDKSLVSLNYNSQKVAFTMGNQVGEANGTIKEFSSVMRDHYSGLMAIFGNNMVIADGSAGKTNIYYTPTTADKNTPWKQLLILNSSGNPYLVPSDSNNIYIGQELQIGRDYLSSRPDVFFYEISK